MFTATAQRSTGRSRRLRPAFLPLAVLAPSATSGRHLGSSNYWETHLPFGGGGGSASGVGRVGGRYAMEALSQVRTIVLSGLA